jgi:FlaA1/EpsC-like NDP-sugar epimerase
MLDPALEAEGLGPSRFSESLAADWAAMRVAVAGAVEGRKVLVVGGAGAIGAATTRQLLELAPARLELIDVDENGLARLARDIRSRDLAGAAEIGFNALDFGAWPALAFLRAAGPFDLVLNFAAVKHVRSEKTAFTALHMIDVNVVRQRRFARWLADERLAARHFVVSTDKAADPASFMGATKRLLEAAVFAQGQRAGAPHACAARFANVAYSSGSLLESFIQRFAAGQPLAAPKDTRRYFISAREAARICLVAQLACPTRRIAVPKFDSAGEAVELADAAAAFLRRHGREPAFVESVEAADEVSRRSNLAYPVLLTPRDTAGEKEIEVFKGEGETTEDLGLAALEALAPAPIAADALDAALANLEAMVRGERAAPTLADLEAVIGAVLPGFHHVASDARLDDRI